MALLTQLVTILHGFLYFLPLIFFSVLAFWKENHILFMITAGLAFITGFYSPNIISGIYETNAVGVTVGTMLILYSYACAGWSIALMFRDETETE